MIKFVITIVDHELKSEINKLYEKCDITSSVYAYGKGTASSEILDLLGLYENKKIVVLNLLNESKAKHLVQKLHDEFDITRKGRGVSFLVNVSGISKNVKDIIEENNEATEERREDNDIKEDSVMKNEHEYELIFTIVEEDYLETAKIAATNAGARGGTSIKGLGLGKEEASKFLGITINEEKEIMLNVVKKEDKKKIMEAIINEVGIHTNGKGICFSVPVDEAIGLV